MDLVENEDRNIEVLDNRITLREEEQIDEINTTTRQQHGDPYLASDSSGKIEGRRLDMTRVEI